MKLLTRYVWYWLLYG